MPKPRKTVTKLKKELEKLQSDYDKVKRRLQFSHTTINDLRYANRVLSKAYYFVKHKDNNVFQD
jgi:thiamine kinase-like enzyme